MPTPISSFVFKIASRCNLDCTYCYEYNMGDTTWQTMPKVMSIDTARQAATRILEHCRSHEFNNVDISFHGGEPLLVGREHLAALVKGIREILEPHCRLSIGMQTNAILLDQRMLGVIEHERLSVGVSLDGPPSINDKARIYRNGRGSGLQVENALHLLQASSIFGGILCVIDVSSDPLEVFNYLASFEPPTLDFLLPHGNWTNPPPLKGQANTAYGKWLATIFDAWIGGSHSGINIRFFEEIIVRLTGHHGSLESIGLEPVALAVVAADGSYEGVDTLKSAYPKAHILGLNVDAHSLDDVVNHPFVAMRQEGLNALSAKCQDCDLVDICGGGYLPHRYSSVEGFRNPSIYCQDLDYLIRHIHSQVSRMVKPSHGEASPA
jgi:uncharacterized protein